MMDCGFGISRKFIEKIKSSCHLEFMMIIADLVKDWLLESCFNPKNKKEIAWSNSFSSVFINF
jgi:hypothetical protein